MKRILYLFVIFAVNGSFAQNYSVIETYLQQNRKQYSLEQQDVSEVSIASQSFSKSMQVQNVYVEQRHKGIRVFKSVSPFVLKDGRVISAKLSFTDNAAAKVNTTSPSISAVNAISKAANALGLENPSGLNLIQTVSDYSYIFSNGNISLENIPVELVYQKMEESGALKLAWDLSIYLKDGSHYYSVRIDAVTGTLLEINDWIDSCNFDDIAGSSAPAPNTESVLFGNTKAENTTRILGDGSSYRVFPLPLAAPNEGSDSIVTDPSDAIASPYGWHDWDGAPGAEFTTTKGNNVLANEDKNGNDGVGAMAEGGSSLTFDFPFNLPRAPEDFLNGAITNLFYMNNMMHDIMYHYGFDEESGNFQKNNYDNGGIGNDLVFADAQDGIGINNAKFATPPDGQVPRMQMYLWTAPGKVLGTYLTVNNGSLAGQYYAYDSNFAPPVPIAGITADLVVMEDDDDDPYDGCDTITNGADLNGKIAIIRRGDCAYRVKVLGAQNEGAVAVIVVNDVAGDPVPMGGSGLSITIPAIMIYKLDGEAMITSLINGDIINATLKNDGSGTDTFQRDGDLDNMIIAHEYGHGISTRLIGGPANVLCLENEEQMGEGWSDYFGLMLTMKPGDTGADLRGVGTYAIGEGKGGRGIRTKPYSNDFGINNFTYNSIKSQVAPHGVGSVWATMLWDLTWDLIDEYGYDPDIKNGTGGNNIAIQLVMDGLRLQVCSPGFVDARDAILEADELSNGGENKCIIWRAFAKRGLGVSASQGSSNNKADGTEAFDVPPGCALGVSDNGNTENNFIVYPNPSNGELNIKSRVHAGETTIVIFDMNGRKVFSQKIELHQTATINATGLTAGIYVMQIEADNRSQTTKLIIQ